MRKKIWAGILILLFIGYSLFVIYRYGQTVVKGVSSELILELPDVQEQIITYLKELKEEKKINFNHFYIQQKYIENQEINKLNIDIRLYKMDKYIITKNLMDIFNQLKLTVYQSEETEKKIKLVSGRNNYQIVEIAIKK